MPPRKLRKRVACIAHRFERLKRGCQPRDEFGRFGKRIVTERRALIGRMQFARFAAMEFGELGAKTRQRSRQAARSRTRPWTAQDRTFKYGDRALKPLEIKPQ